MDVDVWCVVIVYNGMWSRLQNKIWVGLDDEREDYCLLGIWHQVVE